MTKAALQVLIFFFHEKLVLEIDFETFLKELYGVWFLNYKINLILCTCLIYPVIVGGLFVIIREKKNKSSL